MNGPLLVCLRQLYFEYVLGRPSVMFSMIRSVMFLSFRDTEVPYAFLCFAGLAVPLVSILVFI